jgi:hypothetical protein
MDGRIKSGHDSEKNWIPASAGMSGESSGIAATFILRDAA